MFGHKIGLKYCWFLAEIRISDAFWGPVFQKVQKRGSIPPRLYYGCLENVPKLIFRLKMCILPKFSPAARYYSLISPFPSYFGT